MDNIRTECKISGGLSAANPTGHWWYQRLTAVALAPLSLWPIIFLQKAFSASYADTVSWLASPVNAAAIGLWTILTLYHAAMGVRVVLEDYVSTIRVRDRWILLANLAFAAVGLAALAALMFIFLTR